MIEVLPDPTTLDSHSSWALQDKNAWQSPKFTTKLSRNRSRYPSSNNRLRLPRVAGAVGIGKGHP